MLIHIGATFICKNVINLCILKSQLCLKLNVMQVAEFFVGHHHVGNIVLLKHPALKFHLLGNKQPVQRIQPLLFLDEKKKGGYSIVTKFKQARCNLPKNAVAVLNTVQFRHRVGQLHLNWNNLDRCILIFNSLYIFYRERCVLF